MSENARGSQIVERRNAIFILFSVDVVTARTVFFFVPLIFQLPIFNYTRQQLLWSLGMIAFFLLVRERQQLSIPDYFNQ
jgi:hypothetical protein